MRSAIMRFAAFILAFLMLVCGSTQAEDTLIIHFLDVGQADAVIILCDDEVLMIDGGNAEDSSFIFSYLRNTLGLDHIDYMIATHPHEDHIGGLSGALNACSVGIVYSPVTEYDSKVFSSLLKYTGKQGLELTVPSVGDTFSVGSAEVTFLSPARVYNDVNEVSIVVRIVYEDTSFLFTGDAEWDAEHDMVDSGYALSSTLLKVGHHGSDSSSAYVFLREVMPQYAVISVGADNSYGHPTEVVLSRLRNAGTQVYRTDIHGTIICTSDGHSISFRTEHDAAQPASEIENPVPQDAIEPIESQVGTSCDYVLNKKSKKFHYPSCSSVDDMKEKNKEYYTGTRDELIERGYDPCGRCHP